MKKRQVDITDYLNGTKSAKKATVAEGRALLRATKQPKPAKETKVERRLRLKARRKKQLDRTPAYGGWA